MKVLGLKEPREFFPEEGNTILTDTGNAVYVQNPQDAKQFGNICPVCGRKLTIGVLHRVEDLADRPEGYLPVSAPHFESLVPLPEVIAASIGSGAASKKVQGQYEKNAFLFGC